ncbi:MAG: MSMEG_1061 family FMN-dependent PPOX-type flavoprotein [Mycobacteriales bacterium]
MLGKTHQLNLDKSMPALDEHCVAFLKMATFLTVASCSAGGKMDVSPKGDPAGFVQVLDENTLAIPERPGNRRADTFHNVLENPAVGLIFLVPGIDETVRVNGTASITVDPEVLAPMAVSGRVPQLALLVHVEEVFFHCGKALKRGALWSDEGRVDRSVLPSMGELLHAQAKTERFGVDRELMHTIAQDDYDNNVY